MLLQIYISHYSLDIKQYACEPLQVLSASVYHKDEGVSLRGLKGQHQANASI